MIRTAFASLLLIFPCLGASDPTPINELISQVSKLALNSPLPYDYDQHETHQFIEKIRQTNTLISNNYTDPVTLQLKVQRNADTYSIINEIAPEKTIQLEIDEILLKVTFIDAPSNLFFNLVEVGEKYTISLGNTYVPFTQKTVPSYNFQPILFSLPNDNPLPPKPNSSTSPQKQPPVRRFSPQYPKKVNQKSPLVDSPLPQSENQIPPVIGYSPQYPRNENQRSPLVDSCPLHSDIQPTNLDDKFKRQFNGNVNYVNNIMLSGEGIKAEDYFAKINYLYNIKNHPDRILNLNLSEPILERTPRSIHCIWLTHDDKPLELSDTYIDHTIKSIEACTPEAGYDHSLWVLDKEKLPDTVRKLKDTPVKIREVKELGDFELLDIFNQEIDKKRFGRASDILRLEILWQIGGFYRDTDYRIHQALDQFLNYSFVVNNEPMSAFICNAAILAAPRHPVIGESRRLIKRNYNPDEVKDYISIRKKTAFDTIIMTGPGVLTVAAANAIDKPGNVDIVLPPHYFYPTPVEIFPQIRVVKINEPVPPRAVGVHYWDTTWVNKGTGSVG